MSSMPNTRCTLILTLLSCALTLLLLPSVVLAERIDCTQGMADIYPCKKVDLLAHLPLGSIGGGSGNDLWGWTDPVTGTEYAIMGRSNGTAFIDISDPENPIYVANLPTETTDISWRDIKVYDHYAFVVAESPGHGLQVFDLDQLRDVTTTPATFETTAHYSGFERAHNIAINEESGFAFVLGAREDSQNCAGGPHMIDISDPLNPTFAGCDTLDGDSHDSQCVIYRGPDPDHQGKEICVNSNEGSLAFVDVTEKSSPALLARVTYPGLGYVHQGWFTEDQRYFLQNDEADELSFGHNARTYIWDALDLDAPELLGTYTSPTTSIDHNLYTLGNYVYQANYLAGLRILNLTNVGQANLKQVAFFDIFPAANDVDFGGAWSVYPYFESKVLAVSTFDDGLFLLSADLSPAASSVRALSLDKVTCRDLSEKETARIDHDGERKWNCFKTDLNLNSGDRLRQTLLGDATRSNVRGTLKGISPTKILCSNRTKGINETLRTTDPNFNCRDMGLDITAGDRIRIKAWGRVQ